MPVYTYIYIYLYKYMIVCLFTCTIYNRGFPDRTLHDDLLHYPLFTLYYSLGENNDLFDAENNETKEVGKLHLATYILLTSLGYIARQLPSMTSGL